MAEHPSYDFSDARQYNLDGKLRLTLPPDFRRQIGDTVKLIALFDSVYGFTPEGYKAWVDSLFDGDVQHRNEQDRELHLYILSQTKTVDIDSAGRISLTKISDEDRARLHLSKEVEVVGDMDHFEIWSAEDWQRKMSARNLDALRARMFRG